MVVSFSYHKSRFMAFHGEHKNRTINAEESEHLDLVQVSSKTQLEADHCLATGRPHRWRRKREMNFLFFFNILQFLNCFCFWILSWWIKKSNRELRTQLCSIILLNETEFFCLRTVGKTNKKLSVSGDRVAVISVFSSWDCLNVLHAAGLHAG